MSSASGKLKELPMSEKTEAARMIAKLLASRHTPINEIPYLMENVERALSSLGGTAAASKKQQAPKPTPIAVVPAANPPRVKRSLAPREPRVEPIPAAAPEAVEIKPALPTLIRRAEVIHVAPATPAPLLLTTTTAGTVRGVVQWFDTRTNRGTLRLQGLSSDLPVDGDTLAASGLSRLFKGQEIEATLEGGDETPKIATLRLLNLSPNSPVIGGMVRDRHAKQVVVELKREALSRAAARAEAELLLPSRRAR
jgi:cold shock CspA family protein